MGDPVVTSATFQSVLEKVREVCVEAAHRDEEIDEAGLIPEDLFEQLECTGALKAMWPRSNGGFGFTLAEMNELITETATANASLGWVLFLGSGVPLVFGLFPPETVASFLENFPRLRGRGVFAPKGVAVPTEGGYIVSGQWPFASGGPDPDFFLANSVIATESGAPQIGPTGMPETVMVALMSEEAELLDTWHVLGLRGTNSCDFAVHEVFVPQNRTTNVFTAQNCVDIPAAWLPVRVALGLGHAAVAIGIAQGALDQIIELSKVKRAAMKPTAILGEDSVFLHVLGESRLRLAASRAMLATTTENLQLACESRRDLTPEEILFSRTMPGYVTSEAVQIVDKAYTLAGSTSLYDSSSLQRRFRDIHVATQHVAATSEGYRTLGAALLGADLSPMDLF